MAQAEDPRLRNAYNAALKAAKGNQKDPKVIAARTALGNDRASKGLSVNSGGVGVANAGPGGPGTPAPQPTDVTTPRDAPNPPGPGTFENPVGASQGNTNPGYSGYTSPSGAQPGQGGPLAYNPNSKGTPDDLGSLVNESLKSGASSSLIGEATTNPNVSGPLGQTTVSYDPKTGQPVVTNRLSEGNQSALNGIQGTAGSAEGLVGGFLNSNGTQQGDAGNPLSALQQSTYNRLTGAGSVNGIDQTYQRDKEQLDQTLANKGIPVGSEAYKTQMAQLDQNYNLQKQNANDSSVQQSFSQLSPLSAIGQSGYVTQTPQFQQFNAVAPQYGITDNPLNSLTSQSNTQAQVAGAQQVAGIQGKNSQAVANIYADAAKQGAFKAAALPGAG